MIKNGILFFGVTLLTACNKTQQPKPFWINSNQEVYTAKDTFYFKTSAIHYSAILNTFAQPIPLPVIRRNDTLIICLSEITTGLSGPAHICLQTESNSFYYSFFLENKIPQNCISKDYRSAKTNNADSSLIQQSIKFDIDSSRNIIPVKNNKYFDELTNELAPTARTYRAIAHEPVTAYYVQPGSAESITISSKFNSQLSVFEIATNTMYDKYKNRIANGTAVTFRYTNNDNTGETVAVTSDGIAKISLPVNLKNKWKITATINKAISNTISLVK